MTASHLPGAPLRTSPPPRPGRVSPRAALRTCLVAVALVLLVVALSGCGNAELPRAEPVAPTPPPTTVAPPAPTTPTTTEPDTTGPAADPTTTRSAPTTGGRTAAPREPAPAPRGGGNPEARGPATSGGRATPIWPATDAAAAKDLQQQVDGGRQPWLLDPTEVATSYVGVELNYRDPTLRTVRPGVVEVQDGTGPGRATITLAQTVRQGDGGIWLVTGADRH